MKSEFCLNYKEESSDIKLLTEIYFRLRTNFSFERNKELILMYEKKIKGFGYIKDLTINEILNSKDEDVKRTGLSYIFGCNPNQISLTNDEAISGEIVYHWGDLVLRELEVFEGNLPKYVCGEVYLNYLESFKGNLPEYVGLHLSLPALRFMKGNLPKYVGYDLDLDLDLGCFDFDFFESNFPEYIGSDLDLRSLQYFEGNLPKYVGSSLILDSISFLKSDLPKHIGDCLYLRNLMSFQGNLPDYVYNFIFLNSKLSEETKNLFIQKFGDKVVFN